MGFGEYAAQLRLIFDPTSAPPDSRVSTLAAIMPGPWGRALIWAFVAR